MALVDAGDGRRLERFGALLVDRPAPVATWPRRDPGAWADPDLRFEPGQGWSGRANADEPWTATLDGLTLELRATSSGGVGLYPEHAANAGWLTDRIAERAGERGEPHVLNLFAHTGLLTLVAARAGALVAHVDASRGAVAWARRNAALSALDDRPIRWLVDDAVAFVEREARRGRRYDGIVLDPPSLGHAGSRRWRLEDDLPGLLAACARVAAPDAFVLLTAHTTGIDGESLAGEVAVAFPALRPSAATLELVGATGARLLLGWSVRAARRAAARGVNAR